MIVAPELSIHYEFNQIGALLDVVDVFNIDTTQGAEVKADPLSPRWTSEVSNHFYIMPRHNRCVARKPLQRYVVPL